MSLITIIKRMRPNNIHFLAYKYFDVINRRQQYSRPMSADKMPAGKMNDSKIITDTQWTNNNKINKQTTNVLGWQRIDVVAAKQKTSHKK